jgi:hypothetical protein
MSIKTRLSKLERQHSDEPLGLAARLERAFARKAAGESPRYSREELEADLAKLNPESFQARVTRAWLRAVEAKQ